MLVQTRPLPSAETISSAMANLEDAIYRGIPGFYAKNFEDKSWSAAVEAIIRDERLVGPISRLSSICSWDEPEDLVSWLQNFEALISSNNQLTVRLQAYSLGKTGTVELDIEGHASQGVTGTTRAFGMFHPDESMFNNDDGGVNDDTIRHFCTRASQIFGTQSARYSLHGFIVRGTTIELWTFDRSGAYSSIPLDLNGGLNRFTRILLGYALMSDEEVGFNTFVQRSLYRNSQQVEFDGGISFHLIPKPLAIAEDIVGRGTTCYVAAASPSSTSSPNYVVKFAWRDDNEPSEMLMLQRAQDRNAWGIVNAVSYQEIVSTTTLRCGLQFPEAVVARTLSCMVTTPFARPLQNFASIHELMLALRDYVKALRSLYQDAGILHRDVAIKNLMIAPQTTDADDPVGILIDFDYALDLARRRPQEPLVGSDGFMAIEVLFGQPATYRTDLESLFYVFLWLAVAKKPVCDTANEILESLPPTSRFRKWCSMDFVAVGLDKMAAMGPESFDAILSEFHPDFVHLQGLATHLRTLLFPIVGGEVFTDTDMDTVATDKLYKAMAGAFDLAARQNRPIEERL